MANMVSIRYQPRLIEEAVFLAVRGHPEEASFHAGCDRFYGIADAEERDRLFERYHASWFRRLRLGESIEQAFLEQPTVAGKVRTCVVGQATTQKDEAAELFVNPVEEGLSEVDRRSVGLLLRPQSLSDRRRLLTFLRHELFHIADMVDPAFAYDPVLPAIEGGPTHDVLLRNRYRTLWDATIDGRLVRRGWAPPSRRDVRWHEFERTFPMLEENMAHIFSHFFDQGPHTHAELLAFACHPYAVSATASVLDPGNRCALCRFPTHTFEPRPEVLPDGVIAQINRDFPGWRPVQGLCTQCADLYRSRATLRS